MYGNREEPYRDAIHGPADRDARNGVRHWNYYQVDGKWIVPSADEIIIDLECCGGAIPILLDSLLPKASPEESLILLGAILLVVREDQPARERFNKLREAAEEASLTMVHEQIYRNARKGDVQSMKFVLERRAKNLFGKDAKGVDDNEEWIKQRTKELLEG